MSITVSKNVSLKPFNTFGLDVRASGFVSYDEAADLKDVSDLLNDDRPWLHVGRGSNLLFTGDFAGTVVHSDVKFIDICNETADFVELRVGSGILWDDLCAMAAEKNWYGIENLSLIPGEAGAAAVQNIGAYGAEAAQVIQLVETWDMAAGQERIFNVDECRYAYRDSIFKGEMKGRSIVTAIVVRLSMKPVVHLDYGQLKMVFQNTPTPSAKAVREAVIDIRRSKLPDPDVLGSAGSFFKNPVVSDAVYRRLLGQYPDMPRYVLEGGRVKIPAAWLIEQCGWKGKTMGGAAVYEKQPLILVNLNYASSADIVNLAAAIQDSVHEKFGVELSPEVNYI